MNRQDSFAMICALLMMTMLAVPMAAAPGPVADAPLATEPPAALAAPGPVEPDTIVIQPNGTVGKDTWIDNFNPDANNGNESVLAVGNLTGSRANGLMQFDIGPSTATLKYAVLSLYTGDIQNPPYGTNVSVFPAGNSWEEWGANWSHRTAVLPWDTPGGDYDLTPTSYINVSQLNVEYSWNVTEIVKHWLSGTIPNNGLLLYGDPININQNAVRFISSEYPDARFRPKLTLTYSAEITDPVGAQAFQEDDPARSIPLSGRGSGSVEHVSGPDNDTNPYPFDGTNVQGRFQTLYTPDQVGAEGVIQRISFNRSLLEVGNFSDFKIFMAHTNLENLTNTFDDNYNGFLIEVFSEQNVFLNSSNGDSWVHFDLNGNFTYDSQHNLIIDLRWDGSGGTAVRTDTTDFPAGYARRLYNFAGAATGTLSPRNPVTRFLVDVADNAAIDNGTTAHAWTFETGSRRHQMLYNSSMINESGIIDKLAFLSSQAGGEWSNLTNVSIRLAHSTNQTLGTVFEAHRSGNWVEVLNTPSLNLSSADELDWVEIDIGNNFNYNGFDNLLIDLRYTGGTSQDGTLDIYAFTPSTYNGYLRGTSHDATTGASWDRYNDIQIRFADSASLTWSATSSDPAMFTASVSGGNLVITPQPDQFGTGTAHLRLTNSNGESVTQDVPVTINAINDAPTINAISDVSCTEDIPYILNITGALDDVDDDMENLNINTDSPYVFPDGKELEFLYPEGWTQDNVTVTVSDDGGEEATTDIHVIITPVNDEPVLVDFSGAFSCDATVAKALTLEADDEETPDNMTLFVDSPYVTVNGSKLTFLYPKGIGTDTVAVHVIDGEIYGSRNNVSYALNVTVTDHPEVTNHAPTGDSVPIVSPVRVTFDMNMNATTVENAFSMKLGSADINGTFSWDGNRTVTFTPEGYMAEGNYSVHIAATARNTAGASMLHAYNWAFVVVYGDYDGDGMPDQYELDNGLDPETDDAAADLDGDGMPNLYEFQNDLDPQDPADADLDSDGDGVTNLEEYEAGTDPTDADDSPSSTPWLMIIIVIVVVAVLIVVAMLFMRKGGKPEPAQPAYQEPEYTEPVPADQPMPEEPSPEGDFPPPPPPPE